MQSWSKAASAGLGYLVAGPLGAVAGYLLGRKVTTRTSRERDQLLLAGLLGCVTVLSKVAGTTTEERLYIVHFLGRLLCLEAAEENNLEDLFQHLYSLELDLETMCRSISRHTNKSMRRHLLEILFLVCRLQGDISRAQLTVLRRIATIVKLDEHVWQTLCTRYHSGTPSLDDAVCYALLELETGAPLPAVKKAYRRLAKQHHPDRLARQEPTCRKRASGRMAMINHAYQTILQQNTG
ncbi:MAG: DnaJ domain-containing protein [Deltaproteobacteria bacterium]|nr:DnaJ domain-containing protein [Deltaproteobacteria bacterium]MBW2070108.1 DnaJ domain-containing protein [Deltaproteobacteria bacterium]